jgi:hypothetical protein
MKVNKGLFLDTLPKDNPQGTWIDGRNAILSKKFNGAANEDGFDKPTSGYNAYKALQTNFVPMGVITAPDGITIYLSINNSAAEIGYETLDGDYFSVVDGSVDINGDFKLDKYHQVTGTAKKNNYGEIIVAFTDDFYSPKIVNLTKQREQYLLGNFQINDIEFCFEVEEQDAYDLTTLDNSGSLLSGEYLITCKYENSDGSSTNFINLTNPQVIVASTDNLAYIDYEGCAPNTSTSKAIKIDLVDIDTRFDFVVIGCIYVGDNGVTTAYTFAKIALQGSSSISYTFTGSELPTPVSLTEMVTKNPVFKTIKSFTQVMGDLYAANTTEPVDIDYQKFANLITINWTSELVDVTTLANSYKKQQFGTYMHDEVYAFYISLIFKKSGKRSKLFHIPNRVSRLVSASTGVGGDTSSEKDTNTVVFGVSPTLSTDEDAAAITGSKYFQTRCTASIITNNAPNTSYGVMGYWENDNETYPVTTKNDFDSTVDYNGDAIVGGTNIEGQNIRFHRFPSIDWLSAGTTSPLYPIGSYPNYGLNQLDKLGIQVENVAIPEEIADDIQGYEIYYLKKTPDNSLVLGQDITHFFLKRTDSGVVDPFNQCSAGNYQINSVTAAVDLIPPPNLYSVPCILKSHSPDIILNSPSISPSFVKHIFKHKYDLGPGGNILLWDGTSNLLYGYTDYTDTTYSSKLNTPNNRKIKGVYNSQYCPNNVILPFDGIEVNNIYSEYGYMVEYANNPFNGYWACVATQADDANGTDNEQAVFYTLNCVKNIHSGLFTHFSPEFLNTNRFVEYDGTPYTSASPHYQPSQDVYGGDCYLLDYSYLSYAIRNINDITNAQEGIKTIHRFVCVSRQNLNLRYTTDIYSYYAKQQSTIATWSPDIVRWVNPTIPYDKSFSVHNYFDAVESWNPYVIESENKPYRVYQPSSNSLNTETWRDILNNNYYDMPSDKGVIINIQGYGNYLYITHEFATFITQTYENFENDVSTNKIVIGTDKLFDRKPVEIVPTNKGYIGSQNQISCVVTKYGYIVLDANLGRLFLLTANNSEELSLKGMRTFFRDSCTFGVPSSIPTDCPINSLGFTIGFDEYYNRLIVTKKDYEFTVGALAILEDDTHYFSDPLTWYTGVIANTKVLLSKQYGDWYYYSYNTITFVITPTLIPLTNTNYFTDNSWTLSYSFDFACWAFFHDYTPDYMFMYRNSLAALNGGYKFTFNNPNYKAIYFNYEIVDGDQLGVPYNTYITPAISFGGAENIVRFFASNISWIMQLLDSNNQLAKYLTFDEILIWNSYQCSGTTDLVVYTSPDNIYSQNVNQAKNIWFFNSFRDLIDDHNLPFIQGGSNGDELTDIASNIDSSKAVELKKKFVDVFIIVKFVYHNILTDNSQYNMFFTDYFVQGNPTNR